jgi:hypothetical protein
MYCYENEDMALLLMALITMIGTRSSFTDVFVVREFTIFFQQAREAGIFGLNLGDRSAITCGRRGKRRKK